MIGMIKTVLAMKKTFFFAFCAAAVLVSCAKEIEFNETPKETPRENPSVKPENKLETVTIIASAPTTKTTVDALGVYSWSDDETISIADGTDSPKSFTIDNTNKDKGYFTGSKSGELRYAVSPEGVLPASILYDSGSEDFLNLPSDYDYVEGRTNSTMIAGAPTLEAGKYQFAFRHVGALMKYTIANVPIRTKYFKLTTDQNIAGDEIAFDASTVTEISTSDITTNASKSITVTLPQAVSKANQTMSFYVPVPTGTYNTVKAQLCMANDDVLAEKNKTISGGLNLNRTDIFAAPTINLAAATITKGEEYVFDFEGTKQFESWDTGVNKSSMTWTLSKVTGTGEANPGSWDKDGRGQQVGTSSNTVTKVSLNGINYADYCKSSTAVGVNEVHIKAGAKNGTTITCTVSVGGVPMSAKTSGSDSYTAASLLPGTMTFTSESLLTGDIEITYQLSSAGALYLNDITINPDPRTPVTLSFAKDAIAKTTDDYDEFTGQIPTASPNEPAITSNITYEKSDPENIISSFNPSTGVVSLNGNQGSATITAKFAGDGTYKKAQASYVIIVSEPDDVSGTWASWSQTNAFTILSNTVNSKVAGDFCGTSATLEGYNSSDTQQTLSTFGSGTFNGVYFSAADGSYWKITLPVSKDIPIGTKIDISFYQCVNSKGITSWTVSCQGSVCGSAATINTNGSPASLSDMTLVTRSYTTTSKIAKDSNVVFKITAGSGTTKNTRLTNIVVSVD